ncbi:MAG: hypothetical protein MUF42_06685 [Cytophagaceae bacterium]|jgi:hypothetical protein|nr:hypothetical protein [Cytophagaceae bacterium]
MSGIVAVDVAIGLVFIYLLYSLLATILQEIIATNLSFRAKVLQKAIERMLDEAEEEHSWWAKFQARFSSWKKILLPNSPDKTKLSGKFYNASLVRMLGEDRWHQLPSYLNSGNFSKVLLDWLKHGLKPGGSVKETIESVLFVKPGETYPEWLPMLYHGGKVEEGKERELLLYLRSLWIDSHSDAEKFKLLLEQWFDETMQRTTGWYKRYVQIILFGIGFSMALVFNVDTISITKKLSKDPDLRNELTKSASSFLAENKDLNEEMKARQRTIDSLLKSDTSRSTKDSLLQAQTKADSLARLVIQRNKELWNKAKTLYEQDIAGVQQLLGLGWKKGSYTTYFGTFSAPVPIGGWSFSILIGWIITALAISLGAPFWFDMLNKLMKLKGTGSKSQDSNLQTTTSSQPAATIMQRKG